MRSQYFSSQSTKPTLTHSSTTSVCHQKAKKASKLLALCLALGTSPSQSASSFSLLHSAQALQISSGSNNRIYTQESLQKARKSMKDDRVHSDADVAAYAQAVASGAKFVELTSDEKESVEDAQNQLESPYAMGLDQKELNKLKKLSNLKKVSAVTKTEDQIAAELPEDGLDVTDMVQLSSSIETHTLSNSIQSAKSTSSSNQKEKQKQKSKNDNPWDTMINMNSMTTSVIDRTTPRVKKDTVKQRQDEQKAAEEEQAAINDARMELLKPEPIDNTSLQMGQQTRGSIKFIEEVGSETEAEKLGEIMKENADAAAQGSLDHKKHTDGPESRASLSQALNSENQNKEEVDEIINTRVVNIADLTGKSDSDMQQDFEKMKKSEKKESEADRQKELNRQTLESLAEGNPAAEEDKDAQKLASLKKEIDTEDQDQEQKEKEESGGKQSDKEDGPDKVEKKEKPKSQKKKETPKKQPAKPAPQPKKEQTTPEIKPKKKKISLSTDAESVIDQVVESSYQTNTPKDEAKEQPAPPKDEAKEQPSQSLASVEQPPAPIPEPVAKPQKPAPKSQPLPQKQQQNQDVPSQGDIAAVLEKVMEQSAANGQKVDVNDISPDLIAQLMAQNGQGGGADGDQAASAAAEQEAQQALAQQQAQSLAEAKSSDATSKLSSLAQEKELQQQIEAEEEKKQLEAEEQAQAAEIAKSEQAPANVNAIVQATLKKHLNNQNDNLNNKQADESQKKQDLADIESKSQAKASTINSIKEVPKPKGVSVPPKAEIKTKPQIDTKKASVNKPQKKLPAPPKKQAAPPKASATPKKAAAPEQNKASVQELTKKAIQNALKKGHSKNLPAKSEQKPANKVEAKTAVTTPKPKAQSAPAKPNVVSKPNALPQKAVQIESKKPNQDKKTTTIPSSIPAPAPVSTQAPAPARSETLPKPMPQPKPVATPVAPQAPQPQVAPAEAQPQQAAAQVGTEAQQESAQTMMIPAGSAIPAGYEVVQEGPEQQQTAAQQITNEQQQQPVTGAAVQPTQISEQQASSQTTQGAQAVGQSNIQNVAAEQTATEQQIVSDQTAQVPVQNQQQSQLPSPQEEQQIQQQAHEIAQSQANEQAAQQAQIQEAQTAQEAAQEQLNQKQVNQIQPAQMMIQQEAQSIPVTTQTQPSQNTVESAQAQPLASVPSAEKQDDSQQDFLDQALSKPAGTFISSTTQPQQQPQPKPASKPTTAANPTNPKAIEVLGELVDSSQNSKPADHGFIDTSKPNQQNSQQVILNVAPAQAPQVAQKQNEQSQQKPKVAPKGNVTPLKTQSAPKNQMQTSAKNQQNPPQKK